jgi:NAD(P)-dependent dehydrogenase (short-subunit alcohol dehydrogenase family)
VEEWYKIIGVDLTGPFVCSREAVKQMQKQVNPGGGCIINISSVRQQIPKPREMFPSQLFGQYQVLDMNTGLYAAWLSHLYLLLNN